MLQVLYILAVCIGLPVLLIVWYVFVRVTACAVYNAKYEAMRKAVNPAPKDKPTNE